MKTKNNMFTEYKRDSQLLNNNNSQEVETITKNALNLKQKERPSFLINWYKTKDEAIIPTKRVEDAGFDIYTVENNVWLKPHQTRLFSTGIAYAFDEVGPFFIAKDRGSTGSKGIHCHCGVCDNGYRGEVFIALCNTNNYPILFTDKVSKVEMKRKWYGKKYMCYPISKGIAQLVLFNSNFDYVPCEVEKDEWETVYLNNSQRGETKLGQSGK